MNSDFARAELRSVEMMLHLGIDPDFNLLCGDLMPRDLDVIASRCQQCDATWKCDRFLAGDQSDEAPPFCQNRFLFDFLRKCSAPAQGGSPRA